MKEENYRLLVSQVDALVGRRDRCYYCHPCQRECPLQRCLPPSVLLGGLLPRGGRRAVARTLPGPCGLLPIGYGKVCAAPPGSGARPSSCPTWRLFRGISPAASLSRSEIVVPLKHADGTVCACSTSTARSLQHSTTPTGTISSRWRPWWPVQLQAASENGQQ